MLKECDECFGEGFDLSLEDTVSCPLCEEAGTIIGAVCDVCNGVGCGRCDGLGILNDFECPRCEGTGSIQIPQKCSRCRGKKTIPDLDEV